MSKFGTLLLIGLIICCISLPLFAQELGIQQNHYKVYRAKAPEQFKPIDVALKDQFTKEPIKARLVSIDLFANPVKKTRVTAVAAPVTSPIVNPNAHLTWYRFEKPEMAKYVVGFNNQFGQQKWTVGNAEFLLVPTQKIEPNSSMPKEFNHFKAYRVLKGDFKPLQVQLLDQFDKEGKPVVVEVVKPAFFCNPTMKNKEPIFNEKYHLACYIIEKPEPAKVSAVGTVDQFGKRKLELGPQTLLCLPTIKNGFEPIK